ncbi:MAG: TIGR00730 family Rossman fold protein [Planctomycetaceae bacterium]
MTDRPTPPDQFDPSLSYQEILSTPLAEQLRAAAPQDLAGRMSDEIPDDVFDPDPAELTRQPRAPITLESLIAEMKLNVEKLGRDNATMGDVKILARALKELRYAFKVFTPYRHVRKVTVFGSARTKPDHPSYQQSVEFGRRMAALGWMVVTGAGGGIMEGAHVGAGRDMAMGVNIMLPFEQAANSIIAKDHKLINLKYFFTRKLLFVKEVSAIVLFPGGFGTQDECFETLTLIQTGKHELMPIVCVDEPNNDYWTKWRRYLHDELLSEGWIAPEDLSLFRVTNSVDAAVNEILHFFRAYHSMRFVRGQLVLRLNLPISDALLTRLNDEFTDLLEVGRITRATAHHLESDEPDAFALPRLTLQFDRKKVGRLRQMVDVINNEA